MKYTQATVEIRSIPHGEAPFWVREKWVGLKLPTVLQKGSPVSARTFGVLSGPRTWLSQFRAFVCGRTKREFGFVVPVLPAMHALEKRSPEAASWWRENASHLMQRGACFLFEASCGRVCEDTGQIQPPDATAMEDLG